MEHQHNEECKDLVVMEKRIQVSPSFTCVLSLVVVLLTYVRTACACLVRPCSRTLVLVMSSLYSINILSHGKACRSNTCNWVPVKYSLGLMHTYFILFDTSWCSMCYPAYGWLHSSDSNVELS